MSIRRVLLHSKLARCMIFSTVSILILLFVNYVMDSSYNISSGILRIPNMTHGHFLCYTCNGRLGNHMFQFASLTGIAFLNNRTVIVGKEDYLYRVFDLKNVTVLENRKVCSTFQFIEESLGCCKFDASLMTLSPENNFEIGLYLQSWKYFYHVQAKIRRLYNFRDYIKEKAGSILKTIKLGYDNTSSTLIGIHIRIGDIADEMHNRMGLVIAPEGYIYKAMDYMKTKFTNIIFVVASDDLQWSKTVLSVRSNDIIKFLEIGSTPEVDLAVLASCDHMIQTVGSFGWWAGFLTGGLSIYYPHPGRVGSPGEARYNYEDFFPPNWIPIDL